MGKGKSNYSIQFNCEPKLIEQLMQNYLSSMGFKLHEKKGEQYFIAGDGLLGYYALTYYIADHIINIDAWIDGDFGRTPLNPKSMKSIVKDFRESLNQLFSEIANLSEKDSNNGINQSINETQKEELNKERINNTSSCVDANQFAKTYAKENMKNNNLICEIGFWLSILGLIVSFSGSSKFLFCYILEISLALDGLKGEKRKKAITTIVLAILSFIIVILMK